MRKLFGIRLRHIVLPTLAFFWLAPATAASAAKTCDALFQTETAVDPLAAFNEIEILRKSGIKKSDLQFTTYRRKFGRIWIELKLKNEIEIGYIGLWPQGENLFRIEYVHLENKFRSKGLGFLLYETAASVVQKSGATLAASRNGHSSQAEAIWRKMVASGAAEVTLLPMEQLEKFLSVGSIRIKDHQLQDYVEMYGQTIYTMKKVAQDGTEATELYRKANFDVPGIVQ